MKRALVYASVASMIQQFNMNNIRILLQLGYEVDVICNFEFGSSINKKKINDLKKELDTMNVAWTHLDIPRNIHNVAKLLSAAWKTKEIINERNYDIIHCHSPVGGIICRYANRLSKGYCDRRMIYTAHGFHFFSGNNKFKNTVFRGIEKCFARYTDTLLTINSEDYNAAKKFKLKKCGSVEYIPGVGIELDYIKKIKVDKNRICDELGVDRASCILLSVGELNKNKNHQIIIKALSLITNKKIQYIIVGKGKKLEKLKNLVDELSLTDRVTFLGYREDVMRMYQIADIYILPSYREGLNVSLMEAMASGLPCLASKIRGNTDLIDASGGFLFDPTNEEEISKLIDNLLNNEKECRLMGEFNKNFVNQFSVDKVNAIMESLYTQTKSEAEKN